MTKTISTSVAVSFYINTTTLTISLETDSAETVPQGNYMYTVYTDVDNIEQQYFNNKITVDTDSEIATIDDEGFLGTDDFINGNYCVRFRKDGKDLMNSNITITNKIGNCSFSVSVNS